MCHLYHLFLCWTPPFNSLPWQRTNPEEVQIGFLVGFNEVRELSEGFDTGRSGPDGREKQCSWEGWNGMKRQGVRSSQFG